MKVDTNKLQEACYLLDCLREKLHVLEDRILQVQRNLGQCQFGSIANTAVILASLAAQRNVLNRRIESMGQMILALESAIDQYDGCEGHVKLAAFIDKRKIMFGRYDITTPKYLEPLIAHELELETIERYIRPLMAGKKGIT